MGFDNSKQKFTSVWVDSFSTVCPLSHRQHRSPWHSTSRCFSSDRPIRMRPCLACATSMETRAYEIPVARSCLCHLSSARGRSLQGSASNSGEQGAPHQSGTGVCAQSARHLPGQLHLRESRPMELIRERPVSARHGQPGAHQRGGCAPIASGKESGAHGGAAGTELISLGDFAAFRKGLQRTLVWRAHLDSRRVGV